MNGLQALLTALISGLINQTLSGRTGKGKATTLRELRKEINRWHRALKNRPEPKYNPLTDFDNFPLGKEPKKKD